MENKESSDNELLDKIGTPMKKGDMVAFVHRGSLQLGRIEKLTPKMAHVVPFFDFKDWRGNGFASYTELKTPKFIIVINDQTSSYILTHIIKHS